MRESKALPKAWKPTELGNTIAVRRLSFKPSRGRRREVRVSIGQPVREPQVHERLHETWWCPFEIRGLGKPALSSTPGADSVQALVLALRAIELSLLGRAKRARGEIDWLGELERPVFAHTFFAAAYEAAIANLVEGLKLAQHLVENPGTSRDFERQTELLAQLTEGRGFLRGARRIRSSKRRSP